MLLASTWIIIGSSLLKYCNMHALVITCFTSPFKLYRLYCQFTQWSKYISEVWDTTSQIITKSNKRLELHFILRCWHVGNSIILLGSGLSLSLVTRCLKNQDLCWLENTFIWAQLQANFMTLVQYLYQMVIMASIWTWICIPYYQNVISNDVGALVNCFKIQVHVKLEEILWLT